MYPRIIRHHGCDNYVAIPHSAAEKNPTSKIQQSRRYLSEWDAEGVVPYNSARRSNKPTATTRFGSKKICPYNSEFTANPEHGRTLFAPTDVADSFFCRKIATLGAGDYFVLGLYFVQLCSFLISHSSFLIPHSSLKPSAPPIPKKFPSPPCNLF